MKIEYGYDRHEQSWCIRVVDEDTYDVDFEIDCAYVGNKVSRDYEINWFKEEYNVTDDKVIKIKAY